MERNNDRKRFMERDKKEACEMRQGQKTDRKRKWQKKRHRKRWKGIETKTDKRENGGKTCHKRNKVRGKEKGRRMDKDNNTHRDRKKLA